MRRLVLRGLLVLALDAIALLLLAAILPGFDVNGLRGAIVTAAIVGALNALVWPTLSRLALPLSVVTLGLAGLALNGALVALAAAASPWATIKDWGSGIVVAVGMAILTTATSSMLAIDDDEAWMRNVVRRQARRRGAVIESDIPGMVFLEIDGLAYEVLRRALRDGNAPTLARWVRDGTYRLERWETDWSSQTGACQAGLLHGDNDDMPAFRWWEKDRGKAIVTNHPRDAMEIERRHSNGRGLLFSNGASRANIVSGDAVHSLLTMSTALKRDRPGRIGQDYFAYFANPYNLMRTIALSLREVVSELWSAAQQRRRDVQPRIERGFVYSLMRAWATIIQRDLQVEAIIADMYAGLPVAYTTFLAYDEVAHHSGIERSDALATLRQVDRQIGRIAAARRFAPRPYRLVVLSDHGQSQGATFLQRYGTSLEDVVRAAAEAGDAVAAKSPDEALGFLGAGLTEASSGDSRMAGVVRRSSKSRTVDGAVQLGGEQEAGEDGDALPELVVMASGCLGLVSFPREPGRMTLERLEERYPRVLGTLREHPGVGFLMVRSEEHGAVAMGAGGARFLDEDDRVEGVDPLAGFGPNAARHLRRTDGFAHCADIMLNSTYWDSLDEVAAFEELVGSHGGMGGTQSYPFLLHPADLELPGEEIVGPEAVHRELRRWLVELGHPEYGLAGP